MTEKYHQELQDLKDELMDMGRHAQNMLFDSVESLKAQDCSLADSLGEEQDRLMDYDHEIEEEGLRLLTLYQPMAIDLRTLGCILKLNTYLTRIGRYGKDIAKIATLLCDKPHVAKLVSIPSMAEEVIVMIEDALEAFETGDPSKLKGFAERDDRVDSLFDTIQRECITYMMEDNSNISRCLRYIMIARYLERCGDHACKMAEKIYYMNTGKHVIIK